MSSCQERVATQKFGCKVSCTGLYTEISFKEEKKDEKKISGLVEAYKQYKKIFGKDVEFNASQDNSGN